MLHFKIPYRPIRRRGNDKGHLVRDIATIRADGLGGGPNEPRLIHAHHPRDDAERERHCCTNPVGESGGVVPGLEVVVVEAAFAEEDVFLEEDDGVAGAPVAEQGEEVLEVGVEFLAAADRQGEDAGEAEDGPKEAGDAGEGAGELLEGDGGAVDGDDVGVDAREDEEGEEEFGEAARVEHVLD